MDGTFSFHRMDDETSQALRDQHDRDLALIKRRMAKRERAAAARGVMEGILSQIGPGDLCIDCGGNVGEVSAPLAETGAEVYAFEPDPVAFAALTERLAPFENAHPVNAAVGLTSGTATLRRSANFDADPLAATVSSTLMDGKRDADADAGNDIDVNVLSLLGILQQFQAGTVPDGLPRLSGNRRKPGRLAILKLDVEGGELELLPALHEADLLSGIGCTLVETHQRKFPAQRRAFLAMRRQIAALYPPRKVNLDWV